MSISPLPLLTRCTFTSHLGGRRKAELSWKESLGKQLLKLKSIKLTTADDALVAVLKWYLTAVERWKPKSHHLIQL